MLESSADHLGSLIEHAPEGILELDADTGRIIAVSGSTERMLGRERDVLTGASFPQVSPDLQPDGGKSSEAALRLLQDARSGRCPVFEWEFCDRDGNARPTEVRLVRMPGLGRIRASITDISGRLRDRQILLESEARFRTLVEYATEAIVLLDVDGMSFAEINAKAAELFGHTREAMLGKRPIELFPERQPDGRGSREVMEEAMQQVLAGEGLVETDVVARKADGQLFNASLRSILLPGKKRQVRSTIIDVTDHIRKESILQVAKDEAERANRAKTAFLAHMSHEIRTPMNGVLGMLGLLTESHLTSEQRQSAELAKSSAESLLAILNDVLDISKIEAGQFELEHIPFDLRGVVNSVVGVLRPRAADNGVELECRINAGVPQFVLGDPHRLRQILSNLLSNAVKFTQDGAVVVELTPVSTTGSEVEVGFAVCDTGAGIPTERLESIFEPFVQADASVTRRYGGTGLGLAICRQLVTLMGGTLSVNSEVGRGSEFRFSLRLEPAQDRTGGVSARDGENFSGQRVLILASDPTSRRNTREALESAGLRPMDAGDANSALRAARLAVAEGDPFALAIVEAFLPEDSGFEFLRESGADTNLNGLRLVLLTPADGRVALRQAETLGLSACLTKPVPRADLLDCLNEVLSSHATVGGGRGLITLRSMEDSRRRLRVLLAEDNAVNQRVAVAMLKKRGHEVDVVDNGLDAVEAVGSGYYDVVLMDVQMPRLDGLAAARQIRAAGNTQLRIVALTAHASTDDRDRCLEAGMNDFLTKPFESSDLYRVVEDGVARSDDGLRAVGEEPAVSGPRVEADPIDLRAFARKMTGAGVGEIVDEMLRAWLEEAPERMRRLESGLASGDSAELAQAAHALKSSTAAIGGEGHAELLRRMEEAGREGNLETAKALLDSILESHRAIVGQLERALAVKT